MNVPRYLQRWESVRLDVRVWDFLCVNLFCDVLLQNNTNLKSFKSEAYFWGPVAISLEFNRTGAAAPATGRQNIADINGFRRPAAATTGENLTDVKVEQIGVSIEVSSGRVRLDASINRTVVCAESVNKWSCGSSHMLLHVVAVSRTVGMVGRWPFDCVVERAKRVGGGGTRQRAAAVAATNNLVWKACCNSLNPRQEPGNDDARDVLCKADKLNLPATAEGTQTAQLRSRTSVRALSLLPAAIVVCCVFHCVDHRVAGDRVCVSPVDRVHSLRESDSDHGEVVLLQYLAGGHGRTHHARNQIDGGEALLLRV